MPLRIFFGKEFQMGKFSGVLLASDFDDTLVPTSAHRGFLFRARLQKTAQL